MRWVLRLILLGVFGGLVMVGCAGTSAPAAGESSAAPIAKGEGQIIPGAGLNKDVSLVANTERPQFLDSHAVW